MRWPFFDAATETLPRPQLAELQLTKLKAMMAELWSRNSFCTNKWQAADMAPSDIRTLDDLARFEMKTKRFHVKFDS